MRGGAWVGVFVLLGAALTLAFFGTVTVWTTGHVLTSRSHRVLTVASDIAGSFLQLFTTEYPANKAFQNELTSMRANGKLKAENEALIRKATHAVASELKMPPAILWCLLFQESRLDHLAGLDSGKGVTGMGQFTFASFYEVNFHLDRYGSANREMMLRTLGDDVRPVGAFRNKLNDPSSYYYIPTAVAATASYLNNRYRQLSLALERRQITYDPDLLWLYAAMAYNKGGRSVLALWNDASARGGKKEVQRLVSDRFAFFQSIRDEALFERVLSRIWPEESASAYAKELKIHANRLKACAISDEAQLRFRDLATEKGTYE